MSGALGDRANANCEGRETANQKLALIRWPPLPRSRPRRRARSDRSYGGGRHKHRGQQRIGGEDRAGVLVLGVLNSGMNMSNMPMAKPLTAKGVIIALALVR